MRSLLGSHRLLLLGLFLVLLACGKLDMQEAGYRNNVKEYDALLAKAAPELAARLKAKKEAYVAAHEALPKGESARVAALKTLNDATDAELKAFSAEVEAASKVTAASNAAAMTTYKATFVGDWEGDGMSLSIGADDRVEYSRKTGGVEKSLKGASVKEFRRESFDVSLLGIKTTFKIDKPPAEVDGQWKMTIDGAELVRK